MAFKRIAENEYSCLSTDVKLKIDPDDADGIQEGATLLEVTLDPAAVTSYLFLQGDWRKVGDLA